MNLQHERIDALCQQLKLERVATHYPVLAQQAVREDFSFTDFLEHLLRHEAGCRQQRSRELLTRMACFPGIKTLEDYDFSFNPGVPKALVQERGLRANDVKNHVNRLTYCFILIIRCCIYSYSNDHGADGRWNAIPSRLIA